MRNLILPLLLASIVGLTGCMQSQQYQKQAAIPSGQWSSAFQPEFTIDVIDSQAKYDIYVLLRNDNSYSISNLWIKLYVLPPGAESYKIYDRIELSLADASGKWLGRKFGDFWELKTPIVLSDTTMFNKPGTYNIKFEQIMRTDPLVGIHNIGLNIVRK